MSTSRKKLDVLIAALRKSDAALSAAIEEHNQVDQQVFTARKAGQAEISNQRRKAVDRAEGRAHEAISDALEALCKYRPRTPEELSSYVLTLLNHWRIKDASFDSACDRTCLVALLANVNAATAALVFRG